MVKKNYPDWWLRIYFSRYSWCATVICRYVQFHFSLFNLISLLYHTMLFAYFSEHVKKLQATIWVLECKMKHFFAVLLFSLLKMLQTKCAKHSLCVSPAYQQSTPFLSTQTPHHGGRTWTVKCSLGVAHFDWPRKAVSSFKVGSCFPGGKKNGLERGCWNYLAQWQRRRVASFVIFCLHGSLWM